VLVCLDRDNGEVFLYGGIGEGKQNQSVCHGSLRLRVILLDPKPLIFVADADEWICRFAGRGEDAKQGLLNGSGVAQIRSDAAGQMVFWNFDVGR
jgi:hypothetical protein